MWIRMYLSRFSGCWEARWTGRGGEEEEETKEGVDKEEEEVDDDGGKDGE